MQLDILMPVCMLLIRADQIDLWCVQRGVICHQVAGLRYPLEIYIIRRIY
jgi:hypothetical protein